MRCVVFFIIIFAPFFNLIQFNMINKFQKFSGKRFIKSCNKTYLLLVYDLSTTNRLPSYVCVDGIFHQIISIFKDGDLFVLYKPTSLGLKQLLDFYDDNCESLYIEYLI